LHLSLAVNGFGELSESAVGEGPACPTFQSNPRNDGQSTMALSAGPGMKVNVALLADVMVVAGVARIDILKINTAGFLRSRPDAFHRSGAARPLARAHHLGEHSSLALAHWLRGGRRQLGSGEAWSRG